MIINRTQVSKEEKYLDDGWPWSQWNLPWNLNCFVHATPFGIWNRCKTIQLFLKKKKSFILHVQLFLGLYVWFRIQFRKA